jgi:hypothetical protein
MPNERILQMESDEGLRPYRRVEFLVYPATGRARVTRGVGVAPFLLALWGLVYLLVARGFWLLTARFGSPNAPVTSSLFGIASSQTNAPRQTQIGLKLP